MKVRGLLSFALFCATSFAAEIHVAAGAAAGGDGSAAAPVAALAEARDAVRGKPGALVIVHAGEYVLDASLQLSAEDSGAEGAPTVYRAAGDGAVRISGGPVLAEAAFEPVNAEAVLARIDEAARGQVLVADLTALGVNGLSEVPDAFRSPPVVPELFFNDARMTVARWPNEGWAEIESVVESGPAPWRNHASDKLGVFTYAGDRPARWVNAPGVWLQGYWCFDWAIESIKVQTIDTSSRQITLAAQHVYGIGSGNPAPRRFFAFNLLEELDQPGEYYIDTANGLLYFWPPAALADARVSLSVMSDPLIDIDGARHLSIEGMTFEGTAGTAIRVRGGEDVRVAGCTVRNAGMDGISISGGEAHAVTSCDIFDVGVHGISIDGGDRAALVSSRHAIENNDIHHVSRRQRTGAYHITMNGVGIRVAHNALHDAPHQSVLFSGNDHVFEYNEVYNVGMDSDDCGALYMGRNPSERGSVIRYNYFHDVGSDFAHGSCAVYFDDGTGGQQVIGNVFARAAGGSFGAVFIHGGHDNLVKNNIFIDCAKAMGHAPWPPDMWKQWLGEELWQTRLLKEVDITSATYTEKYPALIGYFDSWQVPRLNVGECNVVVRCKNVAEGDWQLSDTLVLRMDAGFEDAEQGNYALKADSVIYKRLPDFRPIPFAAIGNYNDTWRTE